MAELSPSGLYTLSGFMLMWGKLMQLEKANIKKKKLNEMGGPRPAGPAVATPLAGSTVLFSAVP